jgi:hypothetical protein
LKVLGRILEDALTRDGPLLKLNTYEARLIRQSQQLMGQFFALRKAHAAELSLDEMTGTSAMDPIMKRSGSLRVGPSEREEKVIVGTKRFARGPTLVCLLGAKTDHVLSRILMSSQLGGDPLLELLPRPGRPAKAPHLRQPGHSGLDGMAQPIAFCGFLEQLTFCG